MTEQRETDDAQADMPRRVDVELFIVHPTLDPKDISDALGLEAHFAHRVGDARKTPAGTSLSGSYPDTRWRHCIRCDVENQWYAAEVTSFIERLEPRRAFFTKLRSSGGRVSLIIQFFGDGYLGDELPVTTLAKLVDLELALAIECFTDPQS